METRLRDARGKQWLYGAVGDVGAIAAGLSLTAVVASATGATGSNSIGAVVYGGSATLAAVPIFVALGVHRAGAVRGVDASYGVTLLGTLGGFVVGGICGVVPALITRSDFAGALVPVGIAVGGVGGAVWANHVSARRRFARAPKDIRPGLALTEGRRGAVLSLNVSF